VQQEKMDLACQLLARETARQQKILIHPFLVNKTFVCLSGFQKNSNPVFYHVFSNFQYSSEYLFHAIYPNHQVLLQQREGHCKLRDGDQYQESGENLKQSYSY
jgi:hypothetical protein